MQCRSQWPNSSFLIPQVIVWGFAPFWGTFSATTCYNPLSNKILYNLIMGKGLIILLSSSFLLDIAAVLPTLGSGGVPERLGDVA